jgi:major membrane immunogen (membrane-anchored lipoprotein)
MKVFEWILIIITGLILTSFSSEENEHKLSDGIYSARSQADYTYEPYMGSVTINIENNKISNVDFRIIDTLTNEIFDANYEKHFPDNIIYQEQCRKDWAGVLFYPGELLKKQNIDSVDAVTEATWSYHIFKATVIKALHK